MCAPYLNVISNSFNICEFVNWHGYVILVTSDLTFDWCVVFRLHQLSSHLASQGHTSEHQFVSNVEKEELLRHVFAELLVVRVLSGREMSFGYVLHDLGGLAHVDGIEYELSDLSYRFFVVL